MHIRTILASALITLGASAWTSSTAAPTGTHLQVVGCSGPGCFKEDAPTVVEDQPVHVAGYRQHLSSSRRV
jgi:hypothetical protein